MPQMLNDTELSNLSISDILSYKHFGNILEDRIEDDVFSRIKKILFFMPIIDGGIHTQSCNFYSL